MEITEELRECSNQILRDLSVLRKGICFVLAQDLMMPMQITDAVEADLVERLRRDVSAIHRDDHAGLVRDEAARVRAFKAEHDPACDVESYTEKVVEDVQQRFMDEFIDTTWPACPRHPKHPLWYRDGSWWCEKDGVAVAPLGGLAGALGGG